MALYPCGSSNGGGGGGSTVVPNPTGEAVGELTSIGIDGSKYSIPGGGGAYTTTVLFTNGASGDTTFQLSSAYTNFDAIAIYYSHFDGQDTYEDVRTYPTTFLNSVSSTDEVLGFTNDAWYYYFSVYSTTEFRYVKSNAGFITDIIGIKYGSSSGGGGDVTGVKGDAESTYRTGNVNITPTNIGLGNVDNTSDLNKPISTATQTALNGKVDTVAGKGLSTNDYDNTAKGIVDGVTTALAGKVNTSSVGSANGVAELDTNGKVPSSQLPSYVDDVLEYADLAHFPATGETGKIYIAEDTNKTYRWSGSGYAEISESLALGETSSTAYAGNKGKANADAIAGIKNGTSINSFGAVETALAGKASTNDLGDKSTLTTTDKSSCVGAINEVNGKTSATHETVAPSSSFYVEDWYIDRIGDLRLLTITTVKDLASGYNTLAQLSSSDKPCRPFFVRAEHDDVTIRVRDDRYIDVIANKAIPGTTYLRVVIPFTV